MQFVIFERFTSGYLFQIAEGKQFDYLLMIYMQIYFYFFELNFNFLHFLGLTDELSTNKHAEMFACVLLKRK